MTGLRIVTGSGFRLDDNTVIPKDSLIAFPTRCVLYDPEIFPEPNKFDAFRFSKITEDGKSTSNKRKSEECILCLLLTNQLGDLRASWLA